MLGGYFLLHLIQRAAEDLDSKEEGMLWGREEGGVATQATAAALSALRAIKQGWDEIYLVSNAMAV